MNTVTNRLKDGFENFTAEELWAYHKSEKYATKNPIAQHLVDKFFNSLGTLLKVACVDSNTFLEVGCGPGESSQKIVKMLNGKHLEVSEFDDRIIEMFNKTKFPIPYIQESVYDMQRSDNTFDCVLLLEVLEHLDQYELALSELVRVSSRYVVISVPNEPYWRILNMLRFKYLSQFGNTPGHVNNWSSRSFRKLLSGYGRILQIEKPLPWQMVLLEVNK